ncbi:hypothetical protein ACF0H5_005235 [Mactra antiquata]
MVFFCLNCAKKFDSQVEYDEHDCIDGTDIDANFPVQENKRVKYEKVTHEKHCRQKKVTEKDVTNCKKCGKKFTVYTNRKRHEKKCMEFHRKGESSMYSNSVHSTFTCPQCKKEFPNASQLIEHQNKTGHVRAGGSRDFQSTSSINQAREKTGKLRCRTCNNFFDTHSELYNHRVLEHNQSDANSKKFQNTPWNSSEIPPWMKEDGTINSELKLTYEQHRHLILKQKETELTNEIRFNFPTTNNITLQDLVHHLEEIYTKLDFTFKVNISFGIILELKRRYELERKQKEIEFEIEGNELKCEIERCEIERSQGESTNDKEISIHLPMENKDERTQ